MARGRKPRTWVRLDCQGVLHGSINYIFSLEEQAVFIKLIAMAEVYGPEPGLISDNEGNALPLEFIAHELHCSNVTLGDVIDKGRKDKSIESNGQGIKLVNFNRYQFTEYDRQRPYRQKKVEVDRATYGEFSNVFLSASEYQKLVDKFGDTKTKQLIEALSLGIQSKGYKYKDYYATILRWQQKDGKELNNGAHKDYFAAARGDRPYTRPPTEFRE